MNEVRCFRCPMIAVFLSFLFPSPSRRSASACLSRAGHGWIARIVCGSLLSVDCLGVIGYIISRALRWVSSAFLFLARCCCMSGFIFVALSLSPYPVFLSLGVSRTRAIFFIEFPLLAHPVISLAHLMSCPSTACFVLCGYSSLISQYRPAPRPACSTRGAGRLWLRDVCLREGLSAE